MDNVFSSHNMSTNIDAEEFVSVYISTLQSVGNANLNSIAATIKSLEQQNGMQTPDGKLCTAVSFLSNGGVEETRRFLDDLKSQGDEHSVLKVKCILYDLLMILCLADGEFISPVKPKLISEGVVDFAIADLETYRYTFNENETQRGLLVSAMSLLSNGGVEGLTFESATRAKEVLLQLQTDDINDPEVMQTASNIFILRFEPAADEIPEYSPMFINLLVDRISSAHYDNSRGFHVVSFQTNTSRVQNSGAFFAYLAEIARNKKNVCLLVQAIGKHAKQLPKFGTIGQHVSEKLQFKRMLMALVKHNTQNCECSIACLLDVLIAMGDSADLGLENLNFERNADILWIAKHIQDKDTFFEFGVKLGMDPNELLGKIEKSGNRPAMIDIMHIIMDWKESNKYLESSAKHKLLLNALTGLIHGDQQRNMTSNPTEVQKSGFTPTVPSPAAAAMKEPIPQARQRVTDFGVSSKEHRAFTSDQKPIKKETVSTKVLVIIPGTMEVNKLAYQLTLHLIQALSAKETCIAVLPCSLSNLPEQDRTMLKSSTKEIIEPQLAEDMQDCSLMECLTEYYAECYAHLLCRLDECKCVFVINGITSQLAHYLKEHEKSLNTKQVLINIEYDDMPESCPVEEVMHTLRAMRSSEVVVSVGAKMCERLEPVVREMRTEFEQKYKSIENKSSEMDENCLSRASLKIVQEIELAQTIRKYEVKKEDYDIDINKLIGEGRYSRVFRGTYHVDGHKDVAIKVIATAGTARMNMDEVLREVKVMAMLGKDASHKNVIQIYGFHVDARETHILMEKASKSMGALIAEKGGWYRQMKTSDKRTIAKQICDGLAFLHLRHIVHQDIKPSNILFTLDYSVPKLADFGTARMKVRMERETTLSTTGDQPGTQYYQAPEVQIEGRPAQPLSDVWTLCLVLVEWFSGLRGWRGDNVLSHKMKKEYPHRLLNIPEEIQNILRPGLSYDLPQRPSAATLAEQLTAT